MLQIYPSLGENTKIVLWVLFSKIKVGSQTKILYHTLLIENSINYPIFPLTLHL